MLPPIGARYRTKRSFNAVPKGTTCTIVEHYGEPPRGVTVEWDRPEDERRRGGRPVRLEPVPASDPNVGLRDGFSQDEAHRFLELIGARCARGCGRYVSIDPDAEDDTGTRIDDLLAGGETPFVSCRHGCPRDA